VFAAFIAVIRGQVMVGVTGVDGQVLKMLAALNLPPKVFALNHVEPLCLLDLADLADPGPVEIRLAAEGDRALLEDWFRLYFIETGLTTDPDTAGATAAQRVAGGNPPIQLMIDGGVPVAMMSSHALLPEIVNIGNVYVPEADRGKGHAGRIVASELCRLRAEGVREAVLFANNDAAMKAYERLGFHQIDTFRVAMMNVPVKVGDKR